MITELVGNEGFLQAANEPLNWEANRVCDTWNTYSEWSTWSYEVLVSELVRWRRKTAKKCEPLRFLSVTVEEIVDKPGVQRHPCRTIPENELVDVPPAQPPTEPPGTIITWQRAQELVDAGLAVETPVSEGDAPRRWCDLEGTCAQPKDEPTWTYRIPLQPVEAAKEAESVTMTAAEANCAAYDMNALKLSAQLASALGSQKAAVAALETERNKKNHYRHALEIVGQRIQTALNETAGKESGG